MSTSSIHPLTRLASALAALLPSGLRDIGVELLHAELVESRAGIDALERLCEKLLAEAKGAASSLAYSRTGWDVSLEICAQHVEARKLLRAELLEETAKLKRSRAAHVATCTKLGVAERERDEARSKLGVSNMSSGAAEVLTGILQRQLDEATFRAEKAEAELAKIRPAAESWTREEGYRGICAEDAAGGAALVKELLAAGETKPTDLPVLPADILDTGDPAAPAPVCRYGNCNGSGRVPWADGFTWCLCGLGSPTVTTAAAPAPKEDTAPAKDCGDT